MVCGGARKIVGVALLRALGKTPIVEERVTTRATVFLTGIYFRNINKKEWKLSFTPNSQLRNGLKLQKVLVRNPVFAALSGAVTTLYKRCFARA